MRMMTGTPVKDWEGLFHLFRTLYSQKKSGTLTLTGEPYAIRLHFREGRLAHTEGPDRDTAFLQEIARLKALDEYRAGALLQLRGKDPAALGDSLIAGGLISRETWQRFVSLRARYHLFKALEMPDAVWTFSELTIDISSADRLDLDFPAAAEALRTLRDLKVLKRIVPGLDAVFTPEMSDEGAQETAFLTEQERTVFRLVNGRRTLGDIASTTGFPHETLYRSCLLLLFFGLVKRSERGPGIPDLFRGNPEGMVAQTIRVYLELFRIVENRFRENVGTEFDRILGDCRSELSAKSRALLEGIDLSEGPLEHLAGKIMGRCTDRLEGAGGRLVLSGTFNKLLYLLVLRMQEMLGKATAERTLHAMRNLILYAEHERGRGEVLDYVRRNIEDFLLQIGS
jgi:hypothetical protein